MVNRLALEAMPENTPTFFKNAAAGLEYLGPEPDRWRGDAGPAIRAMNGPDHFLDMEYVDGLTLPPSRWDFIRLLQEKDVLKKNDIQLETSGFLPYRIAEVTQTLQAQWREWRDARDTTPEERASKVQMEQNILYTAGILGHYVADGANPHHSTVHYNGWNEKVAPNPNGFTTEKGIHARFEDKFVNAAIDIDDVRPRMTPAAPISDIFADSITYLKASNALVVPLYELDKKNAFVVNGTPDPDAERFVAERLAVAASRLRDVWVMAMKGVPEPNATR